MAKGRIVSRIIIVYALHTNDYSYFSHFYPAQRFIQECQKRSILLRFLFPKDVPMYLAGLLPPLWNKDESVFLIRGKTEVTLIAQIEAAGYQCINNAHSTDISTDKLATALFLIAHNFPTPQTFAENEFLKECNSQRSFPIICKPRFGSRGEGVSLVYSLDEAYSKIDDKNEVIFQEYIEFSHGRDIRIFFCNNSILACAARTAVDGNLLSNSCSQSVTTNVLIPNPIQKKLEQVCLSVAKTMTLQYGTVDFLYTDKNSFTICEVNSSPGFEALEQNLHVNVAEKIVTLLIGE